MAKNKSSKAWMQEHVTDPYVRRAQAEGMRSRAAYKLQQLAERDKLLKPGMLVVDLGAAPRRLVAGCAPHVGIGDVFLHPRFAGFILGHSVKTGEW